MTIEQLLRHLYEAFNKREMETILLFLHPAVQWANGLEGGFVYGHSALRRYWTKRFDIYRLHSEPLSFDQDDQGRTVVALRQIVSDLEGNVLKDRTIHHRFTITHGFIHRLEIDEIELRLSLPVGTGSK